MNILVINLPFKPKFSRASRSPAVTRGGTLYMPYFLSYLTGYLNKNGHNAVIIDMIAKGNVPLEHLMFMIPFHHKPFDLLIAEVTTPSYENDKQELIKFKKEYPETKIVVVGTHPTARPQDFDFADYVVVGEYEEGVLRIADGKAKERIVKSKPIENLDTIPWVSKVYDEFLDIKDYFYASLQHPQITILSGRGCPYNCTFCPILGKGSYRTRSIQGVVWEMLSIQEFTNVKEIMFEDDTFPAIKKRTIELCKAMIERGVTIPWSCNARVDTDYETLAWMKRAGCRLLCVGFESPTQKVLNNVKKRTTKEMQIEFVNNCNKLGILINSCWILGLPSDTKESIRETIEFARGLTTDTSQFYPIFVYPNTDSYRWAKENEYLETEDYSKWLTPEGYHNCVVSRPELSSKEIMELCNQARREFYLRPKYIFKKFKQGVLNPPEGLRTLKAFKTFFKHL